MMSSMIGIRIWDKVFAVTYALMMKKEMSMDNRFWSTVNVVYLYLSNIDCKYPQLPHLNYYGCISVAKTWRNLTAYVEIPKVILESIHKFNVYTKVIEKNQLDATMIYWSIRSAQHVSGNLLPIIRSVRLRYLQHMVSCCCGGKGDGERQRGTMCHAAAHRLPSHYNNRIPYAVKSQSHAPDDGQKIARNMLSWS